MEEQMNLIDKEYNNFNLGLLSMKIIISNCCYVDYGISAHSVPPVLRKFGSKFVTDRQTDKFFDTIYRGMQIFSFFKFATSLLAWLIMG